MPRYDIVFLDADNTLFDFDAAEHAALRLVLEERGYPATPETEALYLGFNRDLWSAFDRGEVTQEFLLVERFRLLTRALGGTDDPATFNRDYLSHMAACSRLLPGAEALCRDLVRGGCRLALATNGVEDTPASVEPVRPGENVSFTTQLSGSFGNAEIRTELGTIGPDLAAWSALAVLERLTRRIVL